MKKRLLACACVLAVAGTVGCGSGGGSGSASTDTATTEAAMPTVVKIAIVGGVPKDGIVRQTVSRGDHVVLVVQSDVSDEIHLHGYDISSDVEAGGTAQLPFTATLPGRFEVELESRGLQIGDITVNP